LHRFSGLSILGSWFTWVRFVFLMCNKLTSLKLVPCVILSMTLLKLSATSGILTTRIGSRAAISAGCSWSGVHWISNGWRGTEFDLWCRYHSCTSPTMLGKSLCTKITYSSRVFPHNMDSGNPITTFSVTNLQSIATATKVNGVPRPISSATTAPGISASETHLLTMNQMTKTWCARKWVIGRPGIEYLPPGTRSAVDWRIGCAFSSLTASSRHSCSNSLLIVLRSGFSPELVFSGLRISSLFSTCCWTSLALLSVFISSSMISFSYPNVSWTDKLIFWRSWNSSQC